MRWLAPRTSDVDELLNAHLQDPQGVAAKFCDLRHELLERGAVHAWSCCPEAKDLPEDSATLLQSYFGAPLAHGPR